MKKAIVRAPATSANLGPGYDCLGIALSLFSDFSFEESGETRISGCPAAFQNEDNLALQAFRLLYDEAGRECPKLHLQINAQIPPARGLGSSSSCIAAGLLAANAFLGEMFSEEELFLFASRMEGHPDNVAPCLYGGLTASFFEDGRPHAVHFAADAGWRFVTLVPNYEVRTADARKVVKQEIALSAATYSAAHAIAMLRALETGDEALLGLSCRDILHEPYRRALIPDYDAARELALSAAGAAAFFISGSGPTMIALTKEGEKAEALCALWKKRFPAFSVLALSPQPVGAQLLKAENRGKRADLQ